MAYWLLKSEPSVFGIDALAKSPEKTTCWNGVRNYQARNFIQTMQLGDEAFFYHSSCEQPGIVGIVKITRAAYPDETAFDPNSDYYDAQSKREAPRWWMVDVQLQRRLKRLVSLEELKSDTRLAEFPLLKRGNRLSVMPVTATQWKQVLTKE